MTDPSCRDESDPGSLSVEQARARILAQIEPLIDTQLVPVRSALGRVLAQDVLARVDVPPAANSAMDGYALRHADIERVPCRLHVVGTAWAGKPCDVTLGRGEAVRIMTGALLPRGADTVVMQEETQAEADFVTIAQTPPAGEFVRHPGDDVHRGARLLASGVRLGPPEIGLLASQGFAEIRLRRRVRVAFFSTGDELTGIGHRLLPGQIYDSNRYTLFGLLSEQGAEPIDLGVVRDERDAVVGAFAEAGAVADAIVTTGGVSVGEADFVKQVVSELGEVNFWKIAMRPGRPLTFGRIGGAHFFGLPGNPVSVAVTFAQFVAPALQRLSGLAPRMPLRLRARTLSRLSKAPGRRDFQRGFLREEDGELVVETTGLQGSHVLSSMSQANCYIVLAEDSRGAEVGECVVVHPFAALL